MLVYVATYPRCGSGVLRRAVLLNFGRATANGYAVSPGAEPTADPLVSISDGYTIVREPALQVLTDEARAELSARPVLYFVKTHGLPPKCRFPGEVAVQMIRHPGAALASYFALERATSDAPVSLSDLIEGRGFGGGWGAYHRAWDEAEWPMLRMRYEDASADPQEMLARLSAFTGLPIINPLPETLEQAHSRNPTRNPGRGSDGWKEVIRGADLARLWELHGPVAETCLYSIDGAEGLDWDGPGLGPQALEVGRLDPQ